MPVHPAKVGRARSQCINTTSPLRDRDVPTRAPDAASGALAPQCGCQNGEGKPPQLNTGCSQLFCLRQLSHAGLSPDKHCSKQLSPAHTAALTKQLKQAGGTLALMVASR